MNCKYCRYLFTGLFKNNIAEYRGWVRAQVPEEDYIFEWEDNVGFYGGYRFCFKRQEDLTAFILRFGL